MNIKSIVVPIFASLLSFQAIAGADANLSDKKVIEPFYAFLSNPSSAQHAEAFVDSVTDDWKSTGDYSGANKNKEKFVKQVSGFGKLIPDLDWAIQDVISEDNKIVVRSRATGTPKGPLFGVDGQGKAFDILTIDIHTIEDGKVKESYHVEDWAGAIRQLSPQPSKQQQSAQTLKVAQAFLKAAGSGDMKTLEALMTDDFVWHNEGDSSIPWIGNWEGKDKVLTEFLPEFGKGLKVTSWSTDYSFANPDQAVFIGSMSAIANNSGVDTGKFSWVVRVHVVDDKVKSWNWFEDSFAVSNAFHSK